MKVLFIVGKYKDRYPGRYTDKKASPWIKNIPKKFDKFIIKDKEKVPSDVAMAIYLTKKYPKHTFDCIMGYKLKSATELNKYDVVFVIFDAVEVFICDPPYHTCKRKMMKYLDILKKTKAFVYPEPSFHDFIINKFKYYEVLQKNDIPVVDFFMTTPTKVVRDIKSFRDRLKRKNWKGIIIKPSYSGYALGIKIFPKLQNTSNHCLLKVFKYLKLNKFPNVTVQRYEESFRNNYEIRTYWINEKYYRSVAFKSYPEPDGLAITKKELFKSEGGKLPDTLKKKLITMGKKVISVLPDHDYKHPMLRIDFGCCLHGRKHDYFVNEVETYAANLLAKYNKKKKIIEAVAEASYEFAKTVKINNLKSK